MNEENPVQGINSIGDTSQPTPGAISLEGRQDVEAGAAGTPAMARGAENPSGSPNSPPYYSDRKELLLKMYDQMFADINRQLTVIWQSIAVVVGAFAIFALAEKQIISTDIASALVIIITGWSIAHLYDAAYWYNRNLVIIANIERQFLNKDDLKQIHYYFGKHRGDNKMITQLRIQYAFGCGIAFIVLIQHFLTRVFPGIGEEWSTFDAQRILPYLTLLVSIYFLSEIRSHRITSYNEFIQNSPGIEVRAEGIRYGVGHGFQ